MTDHWKFARRVIAVSSAVVAACAVVVTIRVMDLGTISVRQPRVLNQAALERQVTEQTQVAEAPKEMSCPLSVVVEVGNRFTCHFLEGPNPHDVPVTIISDQGAIDVGEASN